MKFALITFISFISIAFISSLSQTDVNFFRYSKCFDKYSKYIKRINKNYKDSVLACNNKDNNNRQPPQQLDVEAEEKKLQQAARETCSTITACNLIKDFVGFFNCHRKIAGRNYKKFHSMHLNASAVGLELSHQYDQESKELLRCQLVAKRTSYLIAANAYDDNLKCLNSV